MNNSISIRKWFSKAWETYKEGFGLLILSSIIIQAISMLFVIGMNFQSNKLFLVEIGAINPANLILTFLLIVLVYFAILPPITAGYNYLVLKLVRKKDTKIKDLFKGFSQFGGVWLTFYITAVVIMGGYVLLIIPGIIWTIKYSFSLFFVVDKECTVEDAISYSAKITKGHKGKLFLIGLIIAVIIFSISFFTNNIYSFSSLIDILYWIVNVLFIGPYLISLHANIYESLKENHFDNSSKYDYKEASVDENLNVRM